MAFKPKDVNQFIQIFNQSKKKISEFPGCIALSLYQDTQLENVFYTVSWWESEECLENYRNSELFQDTWQKTKILFSEKPLAFSLYLYDCVKKIEY